MDESGAQYEQVKGQLEKLESANQRLSEQVKRLLKTEYEFHTTQEQLDTPLAFETILGAGAVTVFDSSRDVIDIVQRTMEFPAEEPCGNCTPCRQGTEAMAEMLARFRRGEGRRADLRVFHELAETMALCSLCGLGQAAPFAVTDSLQHFREAYESRIAETKGAA